MSLYSCSSFEILILDLALAPKTATDAAGLFGTTYFVSAAAKSFLMSVLICPGNYSTTAFESYSFLGIATKLKASSTGDSFECIPEKCFNIDDCYFWLLSSRAATLVLFII